RDESTKAPNPVIEIAVNSRSPGASGHAAIPLDELGDPELSAAGPAMPQQETCVRGCETDSRSCDSAFARTSHDQIGSPRLVCHDGRRSGGLDQPATKTAACQVASKLKPARPLNSLRGAIVSGLAIAHTDKWFRRD